MTSNTLIVPATRYGDPGDARRDTLREGRVTRDYARVTFRSRYDIIYQQIMQLSYRVIHDQTSLPIVSGNCAG